MSAVRLLLVVGVALILSPSAALGEPRVSEEYEIIRRYQTLEQTNEGSSGSSRGINALLERVIGVREGGMELEYDLPKDTKPEDRARTWQFPVRVFRPSNGPMQLLNRSELEARVEAWLRKAGWTREVCGRWIFTWNAFRIECDPLSVIATLEALDLRVADLREGATYTEAGARGSGTLARKGDAPNGATFTVLLEVDPDAVRRARAESDVAVGEMLREPVSLEAALRERAKEAVSGTISVTFETDAAGNVRTRTRVTKVKMERPDGRSESQTATETVERRPVPAISR